MSKSSARKSNTKNKTSIAPLIICLSIIIGIVVISYFSSRPNTTNPDEIITVVTPTPDPTIPEEPHDAEIVNSIQMGENIYYTLYADGMLKISGYGETFSFETPMDMLKYVTNNLSDISKVEVKENWFYAVKNIEIGSNISGLGKCALAMYTNTESVNYEGILESVGENAFRSCGLWSKTDVIWNIDFSNTKVEDGAFNGCPNPPVECKETVLPTTEEDI